MAVYAAITNDHEDEIAPVPGVRLSTEIPADINNYGAVLGLGSSSPHPVNNRDDTAMGNRPSNQIHVNSDGIFTPKEDHEHNAVKVDDVTTIEDEVNNNEIAEDEDARSDISDDPVTWDVESFDEYPYNLAFERLAALGNLTRQDAADLTIDPADFESYLDEGGV